MINHYNNNHLQITIVLHIKVNIYKMNNRLISLEQKVLHKLASDL